MENKEIYQKNNDENISSNFSVEYETLTKVKQFMKKYKRYNFNETITDLINLGLANLGFNDKEKALEKFTFKGDSPAVDIFSMPIDSDKIVYQIIKTLSQKSQGRNAHRTNILLEARAKGISSTKTSELLEKLKLNGEIYEPKKDSFKISEY